MLIQYIIFKTMDEIRNFSVFNAIPERQDDILGEFQGNPVYPVYVPDDNGVIWTLARI